MASATLGSFTIRSWPASNIQGSGLGCRHFAGLTLLTVVATLMAPSTEMARQVLAAPPQI
jgi:hypothetical protein